MCFQSDPNSNDLLYYRLSRVYSKADILIYITCPLSADFLRKAQLDSGPNCMFRKS